MTGACRGSRRSARGIGGRRGRVRVSPAGSRGEGERNPHAKGSWRGTQILIISWRHHTSVLVGGEEPMLAPAPAPPLGSWKERPVPDWNPRARRGRCASVGVAPAIFPARDRKTAALAAAAAAAAAMTVLPRIDPPSSLVEDTDPTPLLGERYKSTDWQLFIFMYISNPPKPTSLLEFDLGWVFLFLFI